MSKLNTKRVQAYNSYTVVIGDLGNEKTDRYARFFVVFGCVE